MNSIILGSAEVNTEIKYNVDDYVFDVVNKKLYIRGWVLDIQGNNIEIKSNNLNCQIESVSRIDVYEAFQCKFSKWIESGFFITINDVKPKDIFKLNFVSKNESIAYEIKVKEILSKNRERRYMLFKSIFNIKYISMSLNYLKKYGIKMFMIKFKNVCTKILKYDDFSGESETYNPSVAFKRWIDSNENYSVEDIKRDIREFKLNPIISVIVPVYNVEEKWLRKCIDSVISQYYTNWELCIADDCSTEEHVKKVLEEYREKDNRIKVVYREENGHISRASNSALSISHGEFIALLDNDDELSNNALYEVVKLINNYPDAELIYSDEDKIDVNGNRRDPHFKPDWSPDTMFSCNYITHLCVIKKNIVDEIGGFRVGYEGSQDHDIILRASEKTKDIFHIPKILYHWRLIEGSTSTDGDSKSYAQMATIKLLEDALKRRNENATIKSFEGISAFHVSFLPKDTDYISIIIPTRDKADILEKCLESIYKKTKYKNFEIIVINNNSIEESTFELFDKYSNYNNFYVETLDIPFNYSELNNKAANKARGNLLLFLNNDIEVISENWLEEMAGQAIREHVGAVGAKLLYPNDTVQHCGIIIGLGGVAANTYTGYPKNDLGYMGRLKFNYNYSAVTGACLMIKKDLFFDVSGFTEDLAVAFNDVDLCLKVMERGFYNLCIPTVELYHHESLSRGSDHSKEQIVRFMKEINHMKEKWGSYINRDPFYNPNFSLKNNGNFEILE